jgi:hypothetical protein
LAERLAASGKDKAKSCAGTMKKLAVKHFFNLPLAFNKLLTGGKPCN